jgi:ABC-type enterochelin transport system substrate-binding protein
MRRRSTQLVSILLVLALVLAAAGCGKSKSETSSTETTTTEAAATTTTTTASDETTTSSGTTTSASGLAANCEKFSDLGSSFAQAVQGAGGDAQKELQVFKQFASQTPESIRPDFETIADAYSQVADALKGANVTSGQTPDAATVAKLLALSQKIQNAKFQTALAHIEAWVSKGCPS